MMSSPRRTCNSAPEQHEIIRHRRSPTCQSSRSRRSSFTWPLPCFVPSQPDALALALDHRPLRDADRRGRPGGPRLDAVFFPPVRHRHGGDSSWRPKCAAAGGSCRCSRRPARWRAPSLTFWMGMKAGEKQPRALGAGRSDWQAIRKRIRRSGAVTLAALDLYPPAVSLHAVRPGRRRARCEAADVLRAR